MGTRRCIKISVISNDLEESLKDGISSWCPDEHRRDEDRAMGEDERGQHGGQREHGGACREEDEEGVRRAHRGDDGMHIESDKGGHIVGDKVARKGQEVEGGDKGGGGRTEIGMRRVDRGGCIKTCLMGAQRGETEQRGGGTQRGESAHIAGRRGKEEGAEKGKGHEDVNHAPRLD